MTGSALLETPTGHTWTLLINGTQSSGSTQSQDQSMACFTVLPYLPVLECIIDRVLHNKCIVLYTILIQFKVKIKKKKRKKKNNVFFVHSCFYTLHKSRLLNE